MTRPVSFTLSASSEYVLGMDEIWPDGDAPDNPTAADVVEQMQKHGNSIHGVIGDWNLVPTEVEVFGNHDASKAVLR